MKVIGIIGSPRKQSNTDLLVDAVLAGVSELGAEIEKVYLTDLVIKPCEACRACRDSGICVHEDDMPTLLDRLFAADIWVLGTPVYFWTPSGIFKDFIDRWYLFCDDNPNPAQGKKVILIAPYADEDPTTADFVVGMMKRTCKYLGMELIGQVLISADGRAIVADRLDALAQAQEIGRQAAQSR